MKLRFEHRTIEENPARGYVINQLDAFLDLELVGYIRTSFLHKKLCYQLMPTAWHFMRYHHGWLLDVSSPKELWKRVHLYAKRSPRSRPDLAYYSISDEHIPDIGTIFADLAEVEKSYTGRMRREIRQRSDRPITEYIKVEEAFRRQGIGTQLYLEMAKLLARDYALPLYASSLQSDEAKATWSAMRKKFPIRWSKVCGKKRLVLDLRTTDRSQQSALHPADAISSI